VLAYVFWHRPRAGVGADEYEAALRGFHESLRPLRSASFRVAELPFDAAGGGYEDWYLVDDWAALGELNAVAVDSGHRTPHDAAAARSAEGWGGVYALVRGEPEPPAAVRWLDRAPAAPQPGAATLWQRQMVLGPAPEFCVGDGGPQPGRERV
jgi:hypothetical protein